MFFKPKYNYSQELKKPVTFGNVDMEKAVESGRMLKSAEFMKKQTAKYKAKQADLKKNHYTSFDGKSIDYYVFTPKEKRRAYPAMIYCHGGGFMFPIQKPMMQNSEIYSEKLGIKIFLPEYRISLESPCNTVLEDCYAMLEYVFEHAGELNVDPDKVLIYGDSAGGCLAAGVTLLNRDRKNYKLCGQMLLYPVCDNESQKYASVEKYKEAVWSKKANEAMWQIYLKRGVKEAEYIIPIKNNLEDLPPAYIEPQEIDILCDEALAYAEKLKRAGGKVQLNVVKGSYHGFDSDIKSPLVKRVFEKRIQVMKEMLDI